LWCAPLLLAQQPDEEPTVAERSAAKLLRATVTLRITSAQLRQQRSFGDDSADALNQPEVAAQEVTVCSATVLSGGRFLTVLPTGIKAAEVGNHQFRVTLPGGQQSVGQPRVVDEYSSLLLLEVEHDGLPGLPLADQLPRIGGTVLAAAAAGIEQPLVSRGVLSGVDRTVRGTNLPPLLQCDISTTDASVGAAVIDLTGNLIGVIVATGAAREAFGWSYAVPYPHVKRTLQAWADNRLVVLPRQRPHVGMTLGSGDEPGSVMVERVVEGGPADRAGVKQGEQVFEAEGRKLRSAYQAVSMILKRQPGDKIKLVVGDERERRDVAIQLQGNPGSDKQGARDGVSALVGPQLKFRYSEPQRLELQNRRGTAELSTNAGGRLAQQASPQAAQAAAAPGEPGEVESLRRQLRVYEQIITTLQEELQRRRLTEGETRQKLRVLQQEVDQLKKQSQPQTQKNQ